MILTVNRLILALNMQFFMVVTTKTTKKLDKTLKGFYLKPVELEEIALFILLPYILIRLCDTAKFLKHLPISLMFKIKKFFRFSHYIQYY